jgi:hypothetical protein
MQEVEEYRIWAICPVAVSLLLNVSFVITTAPSGYKELVGNLLYTTVDVTSFAIWKVLYSHIVFFSVRIEKLSKLFIDHMIGTLEFLSLGMAYFLRFI